MASRCKGRVLVASLLVAMALGLVGTWLSPVAAADIKQQAPSLGLVPENAAFYSTMLRNGEQWKAIANSRAWAKLNDMPLVKMGLGLYAMTAMNPESVPGRIDATLRDPEVRKLLDLAADMASQEIFLYGEPSVAEFLGLLQQINGAGQMGPALMQMTGQSGAGDGKVTGKMALSMLADNPSLIKLPEIVIGFKVSNKTLATEQLLRLEKVATAELEKIPPMQGRLKRTEVAGHKYLTLSLDGQMVPWDQLPMDDLKKMEAKQGDAEKVIAQLKQLTFILAIGLRDDYLIVSLGPSTAALAKLGQGKPIADRPELAPVRKFADKRLTSIGYVSKAFMAQVGTSKKDIDTLAESVGGLLSASGLTPEQQAEIRKDVKALAADVKPLVPELGANMAFSFLTEGGMESYAYDWGEHLGIDASKPLGLLEHIGGDPMLAAVERSVVSVKDYEIVAKWMRVAYGYVEKYALPQMPPRERAQFDQFMADARPLLKRLDDANRIMLVPALADGQVGLVMDTKLASKQYVASLPATPQPMPMIGPALVLGVSDADLLRKAVGEYRAVAEGLLDAARKIPGNEIPADFKLPQAQVKETPAGTISSFPLPKELGMDPKIAPNGGLSPSVAVLSLVPEQTERLLKATPPTGAAAGLPAKRPLASAAVFDFAGLIDALTPWVDFGIEKATEQQPNLPISPAAIREQVHTLLDVLKAFRCVTGETYLEGKALVSHSRAEIRDVK